MDIIITNEGYLCSVWRPYRSLLRAIIRKFFQLASGDIINVKNCFERAPINTLCLGLDKHALTVRTHDITIKTANTLTLRVINIEKYTTLLARLI